MHKKNLYGAHKGIKATVSKRLCQWAIPDGSRRRGTAVLGRQVTGKRTELARNEYVGEAVTNGADV